MTDITFVISEKDCNIINDPSVFSRRTPPPDCESTTTISDRSYVSAEEPYLRVAFSDERTIREIEYVRTAFLL
ncbi:hypothetical protein RhiirC2_770740 [Rhizophagus irregularis]|uniref:Uncharacterized protein n=1 Tax=Rhizophagus irregularis TaxID=588596 RepID=A0A2N1NVS0_9GLOM|nr:hypothetical protein RhiirC2_770740 [Rhizophagus irregularis]